MSWIPSAYMLLVIVAFILILIHAANKKIELWIPILLMCVAMMLGVVK